jgi:anion-transporting  ArsA/GET3 family ATPase
MNAHAHARVGPLVAGLDGTPALDVDALIADPETRIIVCCGSGGVGKTTTSAALALRAAEQGRKVVVLTIDPARRLAQSMGIEQLDNLPRPVPGVSPASGAEAGSLDAMMLDMKRTFDDVVESQASPEKAAQILGNPFYVALSSSFAGTQEYMAMEKLGQLHADAAESGRWDLIVVDTPPSRSALDFLDAPDRLAGFLDGRLIRLLLTPAKGPAKLMTAGLSVVTNTLSKVLGAQMLRDVQAFVAALDTLFGGFRQRAQKTYQLLQADGTSFLVVAAPEPDALREAAYFVERLSEERMPLAGLVVNRAHREARGRLSTERALVAAERLEDGDDGVAPGSTTAGLTAGLLRLHADRSRIVARETHLRQRFAAGHPDVPTAVVPALSTDVHDLDGLRLVGDLLSQSSR